MKKKWLALAAASFLVFSTMTAQAEEPARRSITVSGSGQVTAKSDIATLHISVQTESANSKAAVRENANTMTAVRNAVIAAGADASKIETQNYSVYPQQNYDNKGRKTDLKYICNNTMNVTVTNIARTGEVMDAAINAGATRLDSVGFGVNDTQKFKDAALRAAALDAKNKANILASALGRTVVNVISVNEDSVNVVPYRLMSFKAAARDNVETTTPVDPSDSKMESHVTIVFEIA